MDLGVHFVVLGTGDEHYHRRLEDLGHAYRDQLRVRLAYDDTLARRIYAGSDLFLMPSRYEPCGLGQMLALRYGSVPVVRRTGGLADTVIDHDAKTGTGTGFVFADYSSDALVACVQRAIAVYGQPAAWKRLMRTGMQNDFSWKHSAQEYVTIYKKAMEK
jgi:starch synthase